MFPLTIDFKASRTWDYNEGICRLRVSPRTQENPEKELVIVFDMSDSFQEYKKEALQLVYKLVKRMENSHKFLSFYLLSQKIPVEFLLPIKELDIEMLKKKLEEQGPQIMWKGTWSGPVVDSLLKNRRWNVERDIIFFTDGEIFDLEETLRLELENFCFACVSNKGGPDNRFMARWKKITVLEDILVLIQNVGAVRTEFNNVKFSISFNGYLMEKYANRPTEESIRLVEVDYFNNGCMELWLRVFPEQEPLCFDLNSHFQGPHITQQVVYKNEIFCVPKYEASLEEEFLKKKEIFE